MARIQASSADAISGNQTAETLPVAPARGRAPEAPIVLERYRLQRQLGAGAFGTVWMARDERLEREVAVKIVARERIVGGRFEREARAAARLAHPGIVTLYEAGTDDDGAYLVSELVRGSTLGELLEAGRLSDREIIAIGIALCDALAHAHSENVVHRDVKPSNVLVPERPSNPASVAKLTDFGVARIVGGDTLTRTGDVVGTAAYMAPEQAEGREVGTAADLYALALVLYEGLTGINPVRTGTAAQHARRLGAHLPPLRRQRRDLPRELGQAIDLALRPRPRERGSVEDLRRALALVVDRMSDETGVVAPVWTPRRTRDAEGDSEGPSAAALARDDEPRDADDPATARHPAPVRWPERGLAGLAAGGLAAWLVANLAPTVPLAPLAVAVLAGIVVAALPRLGWAAFVVAVAVWLSFAERTGAALLVILGGLLPAVLMPWRGSAWGLSAGAPALGVVALAGAWPALAGRARGPLTRAALGAVGWTWTALGTALSGTTVYLRAPPGTPPPGQWPASVGATLHHVLAPLLSSGALAPAVVWAGAAVILPWLVSGRRLALDFVLASAWAAGLVAATYASLGMVHSSLAGAPVRGAVMGGVAAFALALAPSVLRTYRAGRFFARVP
ncbi:MAG TPA: serine/threonine-protein kinase [Solirubrobacteraceae bacterium]|nr:serine/threonine-protein kinase [Solirubrobacteraceae bacterium]